MGSMKRRLERKTNGGKVGRGGETQETEKGEREKTHRAEDGQEQEVEEDERRIRSSNLRRRKN